MTKNVTVFDSEGKIIGETYPKRAAGLVKNGRARYLEGAEPAIILSRSPDIETSEEDTTMSNYNNEELRARIEAMLREAREKLDSVCSTAADAIDEIVSKIDDSEDVTVEVNDDGDTILHIENESEDKSADENGSAEEGTPKERGRFIRISDEDMEKIRAKMSVLRESFGRVTEEAKNVAVRTGAEIGKYAEAVKAKVSEKLAEREAEADAKSEAENPGSEAYYLRRIEEIQHDTTHMAAVESAVRELSFAGGTDDGLSGAVSDIAQAAIEHEDTNKRLLNFYISRIESLRREHE